MSTTITVAVKAILAVVVVFFVIGGTTGQATAIEYGGIGGRPAFPDKDVPRSSSIFIHTLLPGATTTDGVQVINNTNETVSLIVYAADPVSSTDGGFACRQRGGPRVNAGSWITLENDQVTLPPQQNTIVPFTITVPKSADVGEHNACILVQEKKGGADGGAGISLSVRTGIRVAFTIPGELVRQLAITNLILQRRDDADWTISPIIENTGNVSVDTTAIINIQSVFGSDPQDLESTFPILRDDTARWNFKLPASFWGGWYRASLTVHYDTGSGERTTLAGPTIRFFVPPQGVAVVVYLFVIFVLIGAGIMVVLFRRRARWIKETWLLYAVKKEDTLESLAAKHKVSWKLIAHVNDINPPYNITDLKIRVPSLDNLPTKQPKQQPGRQPKKQPKEQPEKQPKTEQSKRRPSKRQPETKQFKKQPETEQSKRRPSKKRI